MPYNSAHHCVVEVENFLLLLGGEDQWNPNGTAPPKTIVTLFHKMSPVYIGSNPSEVLYFQIVVNTHSKVRSGLSGQTTLQ